jgi:uncharacterized SAM-binding protein YcdF (DUF218 family)
MIKLASFICYLSPAIFILLLPQMSILKRQIAAIIFIVISVLTICSTAKNTTLATIQKKTKQGLCIALILMVVLSFFPIAGYFCQPLMLEHSNQKADAIVVLASGSTLTGEPNLSGYQRVTHGIKLLNEKKAPLLIISTGYSAITKFKEFSWVSSFTRLLEVPSSKIKILKDERITTTYTEAKFVSEYLQKNNLNSILLVTSSSHIFRANKVYKKLVKSVFPAPVHNSENIFYSRGHYLDSFNAVMHELIGLLYYKIKKFY